MKVNAKAWELRSKLFALLGEFKDLSLAAMHTDAHNDADVAACRLAELHDSLPDLFTDAARDDKDQSYSMEAKGGQS